MQLTLGALECKLYSEKVDGEVCHLLEKAPVMPEWCGGMGAESGVWRVTSRPHAWGKPGRRSGRSRAW